MDGDRSKCTRQTEVANKSLINEEQHGYMCTYIYSLKRSSHGSLSLRGISTRRRLLVTSTIIVALQKGMKSGKKSITIIDFI